MKQLTLQLPATLSHRQDAQKIHENTDRCGPIISCSTFKGFDWASGANIKQSNRVIILALFSF